MDAGTLTRVRGMREQLAYFQRGGRGGADIYNLANAEAIQFVNRVAIVEPPVLPGMERRGEEDVVRNCSAIAMAVEYVKLFLAWLAGSGLGPTHVARRIYMMGMLVAAAWHWTAPAAGRRIGGVKDGWNWDAGSALFQDWERGVWLVHSVGELLGGVAGGSGTIEVGRVYAMERTGMSWDEGEQAAAAAAVLGRGRYSEFATAWATWLGGRAADGSAAVAGPTVGEVVNLGLQLETASGVLPAFVDAGAWTPLKLPMKPAKQGYLTFHWNSVRGTGLTGEQEEDLATAAAAFFPDEVERAAEVAEVVSITTGLTDREKCTAEWWAGGPGTFSPPGMCLWWWKEYMEAVGLGLGGVTEEGKCVGSLLDLGIHLFEASRIVWGLKAKYVQARPIQEIRRRYGGMTLIGYDGEGVSGELWMPYQEANFVTPPFADFPSGHSCFSQMGAAVMTTWFGADVPVVGRRRIDLNLMSPVCAGVSNGPFNRVVIGAGRSLVQTGAVPATDVMLEWNTWQEMADSSGLSRLYGGIHCMSAHTSSQHVGNSAHQMLDEVWDIRRA